MSQPSLSCLRRNEAFKLASALLRARGIAFEVGHGAKHPFLTVKGPNGPFRFPFVGTPSDRRSALNTVRDLKRRLAMTH